MRLQASPLDEEPQFPTVLWILGHYPHWFSNRRSRGSPLQCRPHQRPLMWDTNPSVLWEKHRTSEIVPYCVLLCRGGVLLRLCFCLSYSTWWSPFIFYCGEAVCLVFRSSSEGNDTYVAIDLVCPSVQSLSRVRLFATPWIAARQASLSITNSRSSPIPMSIESVMPSSHLILCRPLLLLPPILPSIRVFSNESTLRMRWPKYWRFSFSISPSKEHPGLISFRMDWLDLLAVQGTLKRLLQHHSSKASILRRSAFFTFQLSHPYMTTGKAIALTKRTFVGKVMSLLLNMLWGSKFRIFLHCHLGPPSPPGNSDIN